MGAENKDTGLEVFLATVKKVYIKSEDFLDLQTKTDYVKVYNGNKNFDKKDTRTFTWTAPTLETIEDWIAVLIPLIDDLNSVIKASIIPYGDSYNFLIAEQGSPYYKGSGKYAVRYFGFDFSSKRRSLSPFEDLTERKKNLIALALDEAIDYICFCIGHLSNEKIKEVKNAVLELL